MRTAGMISRPPIDGVPALALASYILLTCSFLKSITPPVLSCRSIRMPQGAKTMQMKKLVTIANATRNVS